MLQEHNCHVLHYLKACPLMDMNVVLRESDFQTFEQVLICTLAQSYWLEVSKISNMPLKCIKDMTSQQSV